MEGCSDPGAHSPLTTLRGTPRSWVTHSIFWEALLSLDPRGLKLKAKVSFMADRPRLQRLPRRGPHSQNAPLYRLTLTADSTHLIPWLPLSKGGCHYMRTRGSHCRSLTDKFISKRSNSKLPGQFSSLAFIHNKTHPPDSYSFISVSSNPVAVPSSLKPHIQETERRQGLQTETETWHQGRESDMGRFHL